VFEKFKSMGKRVFQEKKERKRFHEALKLEFVVRPLSPSSDKQTSIFFLLTISPLVQTYRP